MLAGRVNQVCFSRQAEPCGVILCHDLLGYPYPYSLADTSTKLLTTHYEFRALYDISLYMTSLYRIFVLECCLKNAIRRSVMDTVSMNSKPLEPDTNGKC